MKIPAPVRVNYYQYLMQKFNPLHFRDANGNPATYNDYEGAYFNALVALVTMFPNGYVNVELYIYEMCGFKRHELTNLFLQARLQHLLMSTELVVVVPGMQNELTANVLRVLHLLTGASFKEDVFIIAWERFGYWLEGINKDLKQLWTE